MKFGEIVIAAGITLLVLFVVLYSTKHEEPAVEYSTQYRDLLLMHSAYSVSKGIGAPARFDISVAGGLLPDSSTLSVLVRPVGSTADTTFRKAPMLTVPGEGLVYRRDLVFPGVGKEFEYYFRLEAPKDSTMVDTTLATIPESQGSTPSTLLRVRFEGGISKSLRVGYLILMFAALFLLMLAMVLMLPYPKDPSALTRAIRLTSAALLMLVVGVFVFGTKIESALFGTGWKAFPLGSDLSDTVSLLVVLFLSFIVVSFWKAVLRSDVAASKISPATTRLLFMIAAAAVAAGYLVPHLLIKL